MTKLRLLSEAAQPYVPLGTGVPATISRAFEDAFAAGVDIGFVKMTSEFTWNVASDEVMYILDGAVTVIQNGLEVSGVAGDVLLIPTEGPAQFSPSPELRAFYVTLRQPRAVVRGDSV